MEEPVKTNKINNILKKLFRILMESLVAAGILWVLFIFTSKYICRKALETIGQKTGTQITVEQMRLNLNGSVEIGGLTVKSAADKSSEAFLNVPRAKANLNLPSLFLLKPRILRINISEIAVNLVYNTDNHKWNIPDTIRKEGQSDINDLPIIYLNNGSFTYCKITGENKTVLANTHFQGLFISQKEPLGIMPQTSQKLFHFELEAEQWSNLGSVRLSGTLKQGKIEARGSMLSKSQVSEKILQADSLKAELDYLPDGSFTLFADANNFRSGQSPFSEYFTTLRSLTTDSQTGITFQHFLDKSSVKGTLDAEFAIKGNFSNIQDSKINGKVYCKNIYYCDKSFEYPIDGLSGLISITETSAELKNLAGKHKQEVFFVNGKVIKQYAGTRSEINITSGKVELDKDVYSALNTDEKKVWDDFSPSGTVAIDYIYKKEPNVPSDISIKITALDCQAIWNKVRYPLKNLTGHLYLSRGKAELSGITAANGDEKVFVEGFIAKEKPGNTSFDFKLKAQNMEPNSLLQEIQWKDISELVQLNKPEIIDDFRLAGRVNFQANFKKGFSEKRTVYDVRVDFNNNSVEYRKLPFHFTNLSGNIDVQNSIISLNNIKADFNNIQSVNPSPVLKIDGTVKTENEKFASAVLRIEANNVALDDRLAAILPEKIQTLYFTLKPAGLVAIQISKLNYDNTNVVKKITEADGLLHLKQVSINTEPGFTEMQGPVNFNFVFKNGGELSAGKIHSAGSSMRIREKILKDINAEIVYDQNNRSWKSAVLTGNFYDGKMDGDFEFRENKSYTLDLGFDEIDLRKLLSAPQPDISDPNISSSSETRVIGSDHTSGLMDASVSLSGQLGQSQSDIGICKLKIIDMKVGKVSLIGKILNILQLTEPADYTFEQMTVNSYLRGSQLLLAVDISGQSTAFQGEGLMNIKSMVIDLLLNARGKRLEGKTPGLLQTLTEGIGQGIVQLSVRGSVFSPQIAIVPLPVLRGTLGLFGSEEPSKK